MHVEAVGAGDVIEQAHAADAADNSARATGQMHGKSWAWWAEGSSPTFCQARAGCAWGRPLVHCRPGLRSRQVKPAKAGGCHDQAAACGEGAGAKKSSATKEPRAGGCSLEK